MSEKEAKRQLQKMLHSLTIGSCIHLLAEAYRMNVVMAGLGQDHVALGRCDVVDHVCFCVGVGLDSALAGSSP